MFFEVIKIFMMLMRRPAQYCVIADQFINKFG